MKINNGSQVITGMYVYDPIREYTKDDFVVSDGVMYICTKDIPKDLNLGDRDPKNLPDYYTVYLGDKGRAITLSEYESFVESLDKEEHVYLSDRKKAFENHINFLEEQEGANKYITVGMLQSILSYYLLGPTGKGIIGDYIYYDQEEMKTSLRESTGGFFTNPENIISDVLFHPDINNAILRVSRFLPEISGYVGSEGISEYSGEDQRSVILRQYTYLQEITEEKIRLQELIDPVDGVIWYRSGNLDTKSLTSSGNWKCSVVNSRILKSKVESLIGIYTSRLKVLKSLETNLKSNFRYKKLDSIQNYYKTSFSIEGELEITITVSESGGKGLIRNYQTSINLGDKTKEGSIPSYLIGETYTIDITRSEDDDKYVITLREKTTKSSPENAWFSNVYYKEYYGLS